MISEAVPGPDASRPAPASTAGDVRPLLSLVALDRGAPGAGGTVEPGSRDLLEAITVAVYTTDSDGRITFFNEAAAELWGRRPELGEEWCGSLRLYWPDGRPMRHDECQMAQTLHNRTSTAGTALAERPDGSRVAFLANPSPIYDGEGELVGAINVLVDITAQLEAEQTIRAGAEALHQSNAVKDEFLGLVSHELRTPVTTIYGNAQLLRNRAASLSADERRDMVIDIADDAERLLAIIENLLLLSRVEGGAALDLEPQVLAHVIRTAVKAFGERRSRPVSFTSVPAHHLVIDADRTSLDLLIGNLLSNADKYSPPGTPIEVVLRVADGEALVTVMDRGIGLPEGEDGDQLFTPFYRSPAARRQASGMGIGLAVCKRLAEGQGGRVWAESREGGGAQVGFALPLSPEPEA